MKKTIFISLLGGVLFLSSFKKEGFTDNTANNYDASAEKDNGNCTYDAAASTKKLNA